MKSADKPPELPPIIVLTIANPTVSASWGFEIASWDPPLNAKNPNKRINPPKPARGTEWPGISTGLPKTVINK